jgi:hypothetical protein
MRRIFKIAVITAVLLGCSERYSPTAPVDRTVHSLGGVEGQQVTLTTAHSTVIASTNYAGVLTAVTDGQCSVAPASQEAVVTPGSGGMHTATFVLGADCAASCLVTVTDKKGNSATIRAGVEGGACI